MFPLTELQTEKISKQLLGLQCCDVLTRLLKGDELAATGFIPKVGTFVFIS